MRASRQRNCTSDRPILHTAVIATGPDLIARFPTTFTYSVSQYKEIKWLVFCLGTKGLYL